MSKRKALEVQLLCAGVANVSLGYAAVLSDGSIRERDTKRIFRVHASHACVGVGLLMHRGHCTVFHSLESRRPERGELARYCRLGAQQGLPLEGSDFDGNCLHPRGHC